MDKLVLLRGEPFRITDRISVCNPKLGDIYNFGESNYWHLLTQFCATSFDYILPLHEMGIDYLEIDDWHMFINAYLGFDFSNTQIIIPGIDFSKLRACKNEQTGAIALCDENNEPVITEPIYYEMVNFIRDCHGFKRNWKRPGSEKVRNIYLRDAREAQENKNRKKQESMLEPLISALCNSEGFKYNLDTIWDLSIYAFMDATRRIPKIQNANHLMSGMYSGMLDVSKINKTKLNKDLNWMGELK